MTKFWTLQNRTKIELNLNITVEKGRKKKGGGGEIEKLVSSFLAHLSTKCSELGIVIVLCPSCVINFLPCVHSTGHIFSPIIMKL